VGLSRGVAILWGGESMYPPSEGALRWRGVRRQNVAREAHGGVKSLLASLLRPLSSSATHPPNSRSLHSPTSCGSPRHAFFAVLATFRVGGGLTQDAYPCSRARACKSIPTNVGPTPYWAHVAETCLKFAVGQFSGRVTMSNVHAALPTEVKRVKTRMYLRPIRGRSRWPQGQRVANGASVGNSSGPGANGFCALIGPSRFHGVK